MELRVWWIPQIPMKSFNVPVSSLQEARLLLDSFAMYDLFQLDNNIKPDFSNVGGLQIFDDKENEWVDWIDEETGEDFGEYSTNQGWDYIAEIREANNIN